MGQLVICEEFRSSVPDNRLTWHCPPARWSIDPVKGVLIVEPDAMTDFWQKTHCGLSADDGHLLYAEVRGDVILTTRVRFHPVHQYDQAGLMLRLSADCWVKTSVEYIPSGASMLGAVVTNHGFSDWSTQAFGSDRNEVWLRIRREQSDCIVEWSGDGFPESWAQIRQAHLHHVDEASVLQCGLYACSPKGGGYRAEFAFLWIEQGKV